MILRRWHRRRWRTALRDCGVPMRTQPRRVPTCPTTDETGRVFSFAEAMETWSPEYIDERAAAHEEAQRRYAEQEPPRPERPSSSVSPVDLLFVQRNREAYRRERGL